MFDRSWIYMLWWAETGGLWAAALSRAQGFWMVLTGWWMILAPEYSCWTDQPQKLMAGHGEHAAL
eukprot:scaffold623816_cov17-Prasinocladus_malaysianus.AAC.1